MLLGVSSEGSRGPLGCSFEASRELLVGIFGASWGLLGASWGRLGGLWGRLVGLLEVSWGLWWPKAPNVPSCFSSGATLGAALGPSWAVLGACWAVLGPLGLSWSAIQGLVRRLGALLGASWAILERREAEKARRPKSLKNEREIE